jgi:hypothetical protein
VAQSSFRGDGGDFVATNDVLSLQSCGSSLRTERLFAEFIMQVEGRRLGTDFNSGTLLAWF